MRKCILLAAAMLFSAVSLFAQLTPYEYGHRWYFAFQGGPVYFNSDYCSRLGPEGRYGELFTIGAGAALGYNFDDARAIRVMAHYGRKTGVCEPFEFVNADPTEDPFPAYTYKFRSINVFADYVVNYNALAEYNMCFSAKNYIGLGVGYTFDFTDPKHPEVLLTDPNLVPGFHFGFLVEYDFKDGFGFYTDLGIAFYFDRYNGRPLIGFPLDMDVIAQLGIIYHIPLTKKTRR